MKFFITSIGRSGTKFLSTLLNQCEDTLVLHEPVIRDRSKQRDCFNNQKKSYEYIHNFRKDVIINKAKGYKNYGEVNGLLRRHIVALKKEFPKAKFLHLIRDGRDVVRSIYSRRTYKPNDPSTRGVSPAGGWKNQTRFEKICWYWNIENIYMSKHIDKCIALERLVSDWDYFKENVLDYLGLELPREKWEEMRNTKINATRGAKYTLPLYDGWSRRKKKTFRIICGDTRDRLCQINH
jgi:hypothetical protein